jgi:hypothetical protein
MPDSRGLVRITVVVNGTAACTVKRHGHREIQGCFAYKLALVFLYPLRPTRAYVSQGTIIAARCERWKG